MLKYFAILIIMLCNIAAAEEIMHNNSSLPQFTHHLKEIDLTQNYFDHEDKAHNFEELDGNIVILHFWASWNTESIEEMRNLNLLQKELRKSPIKIIALSQDFKGMEIIEKFYNDYNINNINAYIDKNNKIFKSLLISSIPSSIILNKDGKEIARANGKVNWQENDIKQWLLTIIDDGNNLVVDKL
jgi:thiol-disulfide isomerase/thioredoxin